MIVAVTISAGTATVRAAAGVGASFTVALPPLSGSQRYYLASPAREYGVADGSAYSEIVRHLSGATVVKRGGVWRTVRNKRQDWLDGCDVVLRGGYENEVTSQQRTELLAAGYTVLSRFVADGPPPPSVVVGSAAGNLATAAAAASGLVSGPGAVSGVAVAGGTATGVVTRFGSAAGTVGVSGSAAGPIVLTWGSISTWGGWSQW